MNNTDEKVFQRIEKKYLITAEQMNAIINASKKKLKPDKYFKSEIFNIYFDILLENIL